MVEWTEEHIWWALYERFSKEQIHGWKVIGGQPPRGTSPTRVVRLRLKNAEVGGFSGYIPNLILNKDGIVIIVECKPHMDMGDKQKLDQVLIEFSPKDLVCKFRLRKDIKHTFIKCLSFLKDGPKEIPNDFLLIAIKPDRKFHYFYGASLISSSLKNRLQEILPS